MKKKLTLFLMFCLLCTMSWAQLTSAMFNSVRVSNFSADIADVMSDGGSVSYKSSTNTFVLKNARLQTILMYGTGCNVELVGVNKVEISVYNNVAFLAMGSVTFKGTGSLVLYSEKEVALDAGSVTMTGDLAFLEGRNGLGHNVTIGVVTRYPVWLSGVQLTSATDYVLRPDDYAIGYYPATNTLRLTNQYLESVRVTEGGLTVLLEGGSRVANSSGYGFNIPGKLTFKGTGSIDVEGTPKAISAGQLVLDGDLEFVSGDAQSSFISIGIDDGEDEVVEEYELYINGEQVTSQSSCVKNAGKASISYYPDEQKLVLKQSVGEISSLQYCGSVLEPLTIELDGYSAITGPIECDTELTICGTGSLLVRTDGEQAISAMNIKLEDELGFKNGGPYDDEVLISVLDRSRSGLSGNFSVGTTSTVRFTLGDVIHDTDGYKFKDTQLNVGGSFFVDGSFGEYTDLSSINWQEQQIYNAGRENGYRLLTLEEWNYVLYTRPNAFMLRGFATINGTKGLLLFPDNWTLPAGISFTPSATLGSGATWNDNVYTTTQFATMEAAGAVFLPYRSGSPYVWTSSWATEGFYAIRVEAPEIRTLGLSGTWSGSCRLVKDAMYVAPQPFSGIRGDVNGDGRVSISDINALSDMLLHQK